jgi:ABC-2 type transport system permease protein
MPSRIAMGATEWWEPALAVVLTVAAIIGLVQLGGRVYAGAILHTGPTLRVRDAWRGSASPDRPGDPVRPLPTRTARPRLVRLLGRSRAERS